MIRYIPHHKMEGRPHLMIDGGAIAGTALTLSHWPKSGTPWPLKADLSAEIVFNYLKMPEFRVPAEAATNTHYDTDGLVGLWTALNPEEALKREAFLVEIARAGDFQCFSDWEAWRAAQVLEAYANPELSPLPKSTFEGAYPEVCGRTYEALLALMPEVLAEPAKFRRLWEEPEASLRHAGDMIRSRKITLREDPALDLAVFELPEAPSQTEIPGTALHLATNHMAVIVLRPGRSYFYHRYETWVQFVSRPLRHRVDLRPLAEALSRRETAGAAWKADAPDALVPMLQPSAGAQSSLKPAEIEAVVRQGLADGAPAFDPFDPK